MVFETRQGSFSRTRSYWSKGSNHGWGLAIDLGYDVGGKLTAMGGACFDWMCANAPKFGFYLQTDNRQSKEFEAWHWQYCLGDNAPDGTAQVAPASAPAPAPSGGLRFDYPGTPIQQGSKGDAAKLVQSIIGATPDGNFGPKVLKPCGLGRPLMG